MKLINEIIDKLKKANKLNQDIVDVYGCCSTYVNMCTALDDEYELLDNKFYSTLLNPTVSIIKERKRRIGLAFIDVNIFKNINILKDIVKCYKYADIIDVDGIEYLVVLDNLKKYHNSNIIKEDYERAITHEDHGYKNFRQFVDYQHINQHFFSNFKYLITKYKYKPVKIIDNNHTGIINNITYSIVKTNENLFKGYLIVNFKNKSWYSIISLIYKESDKLLNKYDFNIVHLNDCKKLYIDRVCKVFEEVKKIRQVSNDDYLVVTNNCNDKDEVLRILNVVSNILNTMVKDKH